ncbi:molybdopterin-dependent oxidoreductase [Terasakiella sp. A23]|uniref:molybdopterin-dependent oxidoreductase n=1 Tax=Terasakiella sp. FCG-A23 TaxID=3080561 RepID=UPI002955855D|nr:molybdopterin-dependent oxidoreductase [Terasakiella sp. A23]MDV7341099.1 molybdopterin-dependent oxidoreductase [Terasakiella sp. A23]
MAEQTRTTCPYCGVGCGVLVTKQEDGAIKVEGDPDHPANFGKLCSKGSALAETLTPEGRLLKPKISGRNTDWDEAIDHVAMNFADVIAKHGPDAVAFYVSGQLLTEDYYVANKLIKGFMGTANIDTNSRLCMSSSVAGHKRAFGSDTVPQTYEDLEQSDLVVLVGSNLAWCHPILYQRLKAAKEKWGTKVVVIDPRKTATCDIADLHLAIKPRHDVLLFNGLLNYLQEHDAIDHNFVSHHVEDSVNALNTARVEASDYQSVARRCDLPMADLMAFYEMFLKTEKTLTAYSQGVNQSSQGTDKVNSILNCHLYTGRIGKVGCGPLSVTGQPNAMGGREVGGLANMLAAHMDYNPADLNRVKTFWEAPHMVGKPGLKAVDMFEAVHNGDIKAIWIMATNPVVSLPNANRVREALEKCPFVVVSDCMDNTDTATYADVLLPAATWGERNGTVTNTERRISRQRNFTDLPGDALPDWKILTKVAHALGYEDQFPYDISFDVFKEHVALSAFENEGTRDFDLSGWIELDKEHFDDMVPTQWPVRTHPKKRFFSDGFFYTPSGKANMVETKFKPPVYEPNAEFPYILNTGRIRDHWHTMTRTGLTPRLSRHIHEPYLEINPEAANKEGLTEGDLVKVTSKWGHAVLRLKTTDALRSSELFMPMHWSDENSSHAVVGRLVNPVVDPFSGQPESKHTPVTIDKYVPDWHGLLITREKIETQGFAYWCRTKSNGCYIYDLAGLGEPSDWDDYANVLLGNGDTISLVDKKRNHRRFAVIKDDKPTGVLIVSEDKDAIPSRNWIAQLFEQDQITSDERLTLLTAKPAGAMPEKGDIVCSCFNVGLLEIQRAITEGGAMTVEAIGQSLKAGTNCGSCQSEIGQIIENATPKKEIPKVA